jgi:hypothetical protein
VRHAIAVFVEAGAKRTFASAADWPGWSRSGKDEAAALERLGAYAPRYAKVARLARLDFADGPPRFQVVERLKGDATTDFGAPGAPAKGESLPLSAGETKRMVALMEACWRYLEQVRARAPAELRKGPRGGGRDRDKMFAHVLEAEWGYSRHIGLRLPHPDPEDAASIRAFRRALLESFSQPNRKEKRPVPYIVRRTAWHALDHAWEMEDRIP